MPEFTAPTDRYKRTQMYILVKTPHAIPMDRALNADEIKGHLGAMTIKLLDWHFDDIGPLHDKKSAHEYAITLYKCTRVGELFRNYRQLNEYTILDAWQRESLTWISTNPPRQWL